MDLDAVLARRPEVAIVDEVAHTNVPGSRNEKRSCPRCASWPCCGWPTRSTRASSDIAVHVTKSDGLTGANPAALASQRRLVESVGGT
jgi:hypothetical protein